MGRRNRVFGLNDRSGFTDKRDNRKVTRWKDWSIEGNYRDVRFVCRIDMAGKKDGS